MSGYPFTDVEQILEALAELLAEIAPERHVSRELLDYPQRPERLRANGVYTVLPGQRTGYNYEHRPGDLPRLRIFVYFEKHDASQSGPEIDALENTIISELEQLANEAPENPGLEELILESTTPSAQTLRPDAQVLGVFIYGVDR